LVHFRLTRDPLYNGFFQDSRRWGLGIDGSFPELFGYLKTGVAALLLSLLFAQKRALTYFAWGLTLVFILLDDALELHERLGAALVESARLPTLVGVRPELYAEAVLWLAVAPALLTLIAIGYRRDRRERALRRLSRLFLGLLGALFFFGAVVDALHAAAPYVTHPTARFFLARTTILEDGGELVVLSFFAALTLRHFLLERRKGAPARHLLTAHR
jgi:heme A synthase